MELRPSQVADELQNLISARVRDIQVSGIRKFSNLASQYPDAISLTIGQPDFPTPAHVKEAGMAAIEANHTTYTPNAGVLALREAASRFLHEKYGLLYDPVEEVLVTNGASEAIDTTLRTILSEGDEVILPGPIYPGYEPIIRLCGAVPVFVDTRSSGFRMTAELMRPYLNSRTRCVILPYPANPTGAVLSKPELKAIANLLRHRPIFILSDEIYSELVYHGTHHSIASEEGIREQTIVINGLSKSHSMTGWRMGFSFAPAYLTRQMVKVHQYNTSCASSISQYAAIEALTYGKDDAVVMREAYQQRLEYVYRRLVAMGLEVVKPEGAFYFFPSIAGFGLASFDFAARLLDEERLAVVPGSAFSDFGEGYLRLSYAYSLEVLEEGLNRLQRFIEKLR